MTAKQRLRTALEGGVPDRLPVTTHHVMPSFLHDCLDGISNMEFFRRFGLDPIVWINALEANRPRKEEVDGSFSPGYLEPKRIVSENWRVSAENLPDSRYASTRWSIRTPKGALTMVLQSDRHTTWVSERFIKKKGDIDIIAEYATRPLCDVRTVNEQAADAGDSALIRGFVPGFDVYGQPGCWQDAAVLFGIEELIIAAFEDPQWVHALLGMLMERKRSFIESTRGADYDVLELGGGDASSTVISPAIFDDFVAPYDAQLIEAAHAAGQKIVYHTCGGMMPILESLAALNPDALETFTPESMGGDAELAEAKRRIGDRVCMIGGFDQFHYFVNCSPSATRAEVRRCFREAGEGGGYILAPSDHFFEADPELIRAFAEEAAACRY